MDFNKLLLKLSSLEENNSLVSTKETRTTAYINRRLMQLKNLVARIRGQQSPSSAFRQPPAAVGQSGQRARDFKPTPPKGWDSQVRESIRSSLTSILNEDFGIEMEAAEPAKFEKEIILIKRIMADLADINDPVVIAALMDAQKALDEFAQANAPAGNDKEKDRARMKELVDITKKPPVATSDMEESITRNVTPISDAEKYAALRNRLLKIEEAAETEAEREARRAARNNGRPPPAPRPAPKPAPAPAAPAPAAPAPAPALTPAPASAPTTTTPPVSQSAQTPPTTSAPAPASSGDYIIKKGDTLSKIARDNNTTVAALLKLNPYITNPNLIYAGKTLKLGGDSNASTLPGSSKTNLTKYYADEMTEMEKLIAKYANDPEMADAVKATQTQLDALKATAK